MKLSKKRTFWIIIGMTFLYFLITVFFCDIKSLWSDDMAQMDVALKGSLKEILNKCIKIDNNPPLSHLLSAVWIRLVPYGCGWLKLFNIVVVTGGVFICSLISWDLLGERGGILTTGLLISNPGLVTLASYTFRPYGLLFFMSSLLMLVYERNRRSGKGGFSCFFIMLLSVYTHYFMVLICIYLFIADVYLVIKKKVPMRALYSYPLAAIGFLPWLMVVLKGSLERLQSFWPNKPDINILITSMTELNGFRLLLLLAMFFSIVLLTKLIYDYCQKTNDIKTLLLGIQIAIPVLVISLIYLVSRYSDSFTSLFVTRYFVCVVPELYVAAGCGAAVLMEWFMCYIEKVTLRYLAGGFVAGLIVLGTFGNGYRIYLHEETAEEPFREAADYLADQKDIGDSDVLVYHTSYEREESWDYFLTHKGKRKIMCDNRWYQLEPDDLRGKNKVYVVVLHNELDDLSLGVLLDGGYEQTETVDMPPVSVFEKKEE